jgi:hypothetical protein
MEVVLLLVRGSGAAPSVEWAALALAGAAGVAEGAPGALVVLAVAGAQARPPEYVFGCMFFFFSGSARQRCRSGCERWVRTWRGLASLPLLLLFLLLLGVPGEKEKESS